jgi:hypothetical protein
LRDEKVIANAMGEKLTPGEHSDSTLARIKSVCQPLVEYILFAGEAPLPAALDAKSPFATEFAKQGPRDSKGRSLREFDLKTRLFRHPCSYLIYSKSFAGLPDAAKLAIYTALQEVLTANEPAKRFAHLAPADRAAIADILRDTEPDVRAAWRPLDQPDAK